MRQHPETSWLVPSLGQKRYIAALQLFEAMAGNSSSGVIEAPLLNMPVLNIGNRQAGRLRTGFVNDVSADPNAVAEGLQNVLEAGKRRTWPRPRPQVNTSPGATILTWLKDES